MSWRQGVATSNPDVRPLPKPNATGHLSPADAISQSLNELHGLQPNGLRLSCGLRRPQSREIPSLSSGRRRPTASSAC
jgi:hypothetical protein